MLSESIKSPSNLLRDENRLLNLEEYRQGKTNLKSRPLYVMVELTQGCNLHCEMCRPEVITVKSRMMPEEMFDKIAAETFPTADLVDLRGWGESLIIPKIRQYIEKTADYGVDIRFVSNLSFHRDEILDVLAQHHCYMSISLDSSDHELMAQLRRGSDLNKIERNLRKLTEAYQKRWGTTERISLGTTVQRPALKSLPNLIDFAADIGLKEIRMFAVFAPSDSPLTLENHDDEVDATLKLMRDRSRERGVKLVAATKLGSLPEKPANTSACFHPWSYAAFMYDGTVSFCDHLIGPMEIANLVGDLKTASFEEIWNGQTWVNLRQEHLSSRSPHAPHFEECSWCYKNRYTDFEHLLLPEAKAEIYTL